MTIEAKIICDSISPQDYRLTTFVLRYPKFIHGEFMTHRVISRNASSSRAVPVSKNIEEVRSDVLRAAPVWWGREQKGMQSGDELSDIVIDGAVHSRLTAAKNAWRFAAEDAATHAERLAQIGVHKSIVNRVLEPFLHINVVATATEWMNFFGLRLDKAAQPEMRTLAEAMWRAYGESAPKSLKPGEWHLPFIDFERDNLGEVSYSLGNHIPIWDDRINLNNSIKVSVARCARISYTSFETGRRSTVEEDLALYERLVGSQPMHASPAEHQATPDHWTIFDGNGKPTNEIGDGWARPEDQGNFTGWRQYRKMLSGEAVAPLPKDYSINHKPVNR